MTAKGKKDDGENKMQNEHGIFAEMQASIAFSPFYKSLQHLQRSANKSQRFYCTANNSAGC